MQVSFGPAQVQPLSGNLSRRLPIDANQHAGCDCGCGCADDSCRAGLAPLGLAYNSSTVNVQPIVLATLASDFCASVPSQIQAQLTWAGTAQGWQTFATTGHNPGDIYYLPLQVGSAVSSSGVYSWSVEVKATVGTNVYDRTASGVLPVQVNASSPFGAGWALGGSQSLLVGSAGVALIDNGTGGFRYFSGTGPSYTSPANDQGTLVKNGDGTYTYTAKDQTKTNFDSSGRQTSQVDAHSLSQSFTYSGPLSTITQPDGGVASFSYSSGLLSAVQLPGGRYLTLGYDGNSNLTSFQDAAGGLTTFGYDTSHRLVNEQVGPLNVTYSYSTANGTLTQVNRGLGTTLSVAAAAAQGLGASTAINASQAAAALTDALSHTTSYALDTLGRLLGLATADGAQQTWTLDAAGSPTVYLDQQGRATSYAYNTSEDLTQVTFPDATMTSYQYETTFHQVTRIQNALNQVTSFSYSSTTGDLLTMIDALGKVTTYTWSNGLKQTMTDALARVTTFLWNGSRQLLAMTDALGEITSYGYDGAGNEETVEDALGHITTNSYDGKRRLLMRTNALGGVASYVYDAIDNLLSSTDELGRITSYGYDGRGLQVARTEVVGTSVQRTTSSSYDAAANLLYSTDALGEITSYAYDALNRVVARIEAFGTSVQRAFTTVYDTVGNVLSSISPLAVTTSYVYDALNRRVQRIDAYGTSLQRSWLTAYDAIGNVLSQTDPRGTVTSYGYDSDNRRTKQIDAYGTTLQRTTSMAYDVVGNLLYLTNAVGAVTSYAYDALNRQVQRYDAFGSSVQRVTSLLYDAVGNLLSAVNPRGYTTSYGYDALNRRVQEIDAQGTGVQRTVTTVLDAVGNRLSVTNGLGVVTSFSFDALNRTVAQLDAFGTSLQRAVSTVYDADNNVLARIDALGYRTSYGYDALNRQITVQDAAGGVVTTGYDADGDVVSMTDQLGHVTTYVYDALNRKTQTIDARGGIVTLAYDADDNLQSLTDPVGNKTVWLFDARDHKVQETDPLGNSGTYAYDAYSRLTSATDRNGQRIASSYDLLNRLTRETWYSSGGSQVGTLTFTFDPNDNLLTASVSGATGTVSYASTMAYDALDRQSSVQSPFGAVLTYGYDAADNRTQVQDSFGGVTSHVYDVLNRVVTVLFGGSGQTPLRQDWTYTARDQVASQTRYSDLAGTSKVGSSSFGYSAVQLLTNLQHFDGSGNSLASYVNSYDQVRRITSEVLNGGAPTTYLYDATNQLTSDRVASYSYDLNGNRTMSGYATGAANELTSDGTWSYYYDRNGNAIVKRNPATGEVWSYSYDNRNRVVSVQDVTTGAQMQATYVYDAFGQRIEKDVWTPSGGTVSTRFADDGRPIWADMSASNALQMRYIRGERVLELLARVTSSAAVWTLPDRMLSVRNVVDSTGALVDTITYDGYGNIVSETNSPNGVSYKYAGYRYDSETGFFRPDLSMGRYYNPVTGLWTASDPLEMLASSGSNLYVYMANCPVNGVDPLGLSPIAGQVTSADGVLKQIRGNLMLMGAEGIDALGGGKKLMKEVRSIMETSLKQQKIPDAFAKQLLGTLDERSAVLFYLGRKVFFTGGAQNQPEKNAFVYTCKCGWFDMGHFFLSAGAATLLEGLLAGHVRQKDLQWLSAVGAILGGYAVELEQAYVKVKQAKPKNIDDWAASAFTIEDLPSDAMGAAFGVHIQRGGFPKVLAEIRKELKTLFDKCGAVDPANQVMNKKKKTTAGALLKDDVDRYGKAAKQPGFFPQGAVDPYNYSILHVKTLSHDCVCDKNGKPIDLRRK